MESYRGSVKEETRVEARKSFPILRYNDEMEKISVLCPCCESTLIIDGLTGAIISHEEKEKKLSSFEDLATDMKQRKELTDQIFAQEKESQKDRHRILDEKFKEAMKKADTDSTEPFKNPMDMD